MSDSIHEYTDDRIVVRYDVKRCIHAAECVRGLPQVFDPEKQPWIQPQHAEANQIAEVVMRCPTGALQVERNDGGEPEPVPQPNTITVAPDGPLYCRGDIDIVTADGTPVLKDTRVALCRCGVSQNKPFCDGSHSEAAFQDAGTLGDNRARSTDEVSPDDRTLRVVPSANGPLRLQGPFEVCSADGQTRYSGNRAALCRCGASQKRPFCDGTHTRIGFDAEASM